MADRPPASDFALDQHLSVPAGSDQAAALRDIADLADPLDTNSPRG